MNCLVTVIESYAPPTISLSLFLSNSPEYLPRRQSRLIFDSMDSGVVITITKMKGKTISNEKKAKLRISSERRAER